MAKAPIAGTVKTRLAPLVSPEDAAALAAAFVQDGVNSMVRLGVAVLVAYAPHAGRALLQPLLPASVLWTPQHGANLGARMDNALADAHARGFGPLLVVGTDSPTLPPARITEARHLLQTNAADIVLGPTDDGGYYLLGVRAPVPGLLDGVAWSTDRALSDTLAGAARLGLRPHLLPPWYDIDTPQDFTRLRRELSRDPALRHRLPCTAAWLAAHP